MAGTALAIPTTMNPTLPEYEVVIATRNRASVLPISIPTILGQSVPPSRLIVVDSSDDHAEVCRQVRLTVGRFDVPCLVLHSERGSTRQRNLGLDRVTAPVVFFPDDDSLWLPGSAEAILRVYARDTNHHIGGVAAAQSAQPPQAALDTITQTPYRLRWTDHLKNHLSPLRSRLEHAVFPDPFILHGRQRIGELGVPDWLAEEDAIPVEWMTGFRMTFRTEVARATRFDESFLNYSTFDDVELCFNVMQTHLIVGANRARVFHYRDPRPRSVAANMGRRQILDRAYIVSKYADPRSPARRRLAAYSRYKFAQYAIAALGRGGTARARGALAALNQMPELLACPSAELQSTYTKLCTL